MRLDGRGIGAELPGKWETGTKNHEGLAGTGAAIDYLAELGYLDWLLLRI